MNKNPPHFVVISTRAEPNSDLAEKTEHGHTEPTTSDFERSGPERSVINTEIGFAIRIGAQDSLVEVVDLARKYYGKEAEGYELSVGTFVIRYLDGTPEPGDTVVFPNSLKELFITSRFTRAEMTSTVIDQFLNRPSSRQNQCLRLKLLHDSHTTSSTSGE